MQQVCGKKRLRSCICESCGRDARAPPRKQEKADMSAVGFQPAGQVGAGVKVQQRFSKSFDATDRELAKTCVSSEDSRRRAWHPLALLAPWR